MPIGPADSRHVKFPELREDAALAVYEALREVKCFDCGRMIPPGERFTRSADRAGRTAGIRYTHCRACHPVEPYLHTAEEVRLLTPEHVTIEALFRTRQNAEAFAAAAQARGLDLRDLLDGEVLARLLGIDLPDGPSGGAI